MKEPWKIQKSMNKVKMEFSFKIFILLECNHFNSLEVPTAEISHSTTSRVPHLIGHIKITREKIKGEKGYRYQIPSQAS